MQNKTRSIKRQILFTLSFSLAAFFVLRTLTACSDGGVAASRDGGFNDSAQLGDSAPAGDSASADGSVDGAAVDGAANDGAATGAAIDGAAGSGVIEIFMAGDLSATAFTDGLAGQTPTSYEIAVSRYYTLRSASDPNPALCFDHGAQPAVADMSKDNLVGRCQTATMPTATYTHGRTKVEWSRYTVDAVYHVLGQAIPTKLTVFRAYSSTTYQGTSYLAGQGALIFDASGQPITIPIAYPPLPSSPAFSFHVVNGEGFVTFAYTRPLTIVRQDNHQHWARFHWRIKDAYRWADKALPSYATGKWDVNADVINSEIVSMYGASGFYVTASTDQ